MAKPTVSDIETAVSNIFAALSSAAPDRRGNSKAAVQALGEVSNKLSEVYQPNVVLTVTDSTDANLTAFFAGELFTAKDRSVEVGDVFQVGGTGDTTDNGLATAKGSGVVAGDRFEVTNTGTPAVVFLGNAAPDFSGTYSSDY